MNAQQYDGIELEDLGDAMAQTRQHWISTQYPDNIFGRGPYPVWSEGSAERDVDLATL